MSVTGGNMNHISWNTTMQCNLRCQHCYRGSSPEASRRDELSTEEGKNLLEEMVKAGFRIIVFSGGEPMMRQDILELIAYAKSLGMTCLMGSNGTLIDEAKAKELQKAGLSCIAISLDSLDEERHNAFRGMDFAFKKALSGARACLNAGIKVQFNWTLSKTNLHEIDDFVHFAKEFGAASSHLLFLVEVGRGKELGEVQLSPEEYKEAIDQILKINAQVDIRVKPTCAPQFKVEALQQNLEAPGHGRGCIAGISYCSILPNGDVHICPYTPVKVDSVRERPFSEIWQRNEVFLELRDPKAYEGRCGRCRYLALCGGCRARAYGATGNWLAEDPYCTLKEEMLCL